MTKDAVQRSIRTFYEVVKFVRYPKMNASPLTIAIIAPASPFPDEDFSEGVRILEEMGFQVRIPEGIRAASGYLAGPDSDRAAQVNAAFADSEVQAVLCARGGYGAMRILPYLDYALIAAHPKPLMGFSDITALLFTLYQRCGLQPWHGPVVTSLKRSGPKTRDSVYLALTSGRPADLSPDAGITLSPGEAEGPVVCANLTTLCHLIGTPYQPDLAGHILIIEDTGEKPYRIDRMLTQMRLSGLFDGLRGLGAGTFDHCGETETICEIIAQTLAPLHIPILAGLAIGHGCENMAVPFGRTARIDATHHKFIWTAYNSSQS